MAKNKTSFFCSECGNESPRWLGKCPACGSWNTFVESTSVTGKTDKAASPSLTAAALSWTTQNETVRLSDAGKEDYERISTGIGEMDTLLGGGIVKGSVTLVGGEPGIGKSTILLQIADLYKDTGDVLYVSGEESPSQIRMRAERLGIKSDRIIICAQTSFEVITEELKRSKPVLCIADSIQTLYSETVNGAPGSVSQAREVTAGLVRIAKSNGLPVILVGHITKDGNIAGPKTLEHMVDTVLYFEGDNTGSYRILRSVKNRFGKAGELAFFEMTARGLIPVDSSHALFVAGRPLGAPGSALTSVMEGARALTIEVQALAADTCYAQPQRMTSGPDRNRVTMLLAVAEKTFRLALGTKDIFVNIIGGLKVSDPACDLALIAAIVSSEREIPVRQDTLILGEVGLSGELRPVSSVRQRITDAARLGIRSVLLPSSCRQAVNKETDLPTDIELTFVDNISEAVDVLFS
ncbi:MAG: DNA repair protein RadA [Clostridiales bacterium]|nr:DNA repair protein RadA [Clostridiales bacterium]